MQDRKELLRNWNQGYGGKLSSFVQYHSLSLTPSSHHQGAGGWIFKLPAPAGFRGAVASAAGHWIRISSSVSGAGQFFVFCFLFVQGPEGPHS